MRHALALLALLIPAIAAAQPAPPPYTLPTASTTVLGGVKVDGTTITINGSGVISSSGSSSTSCTAFASISLSSGSHTLSSGEAANCALTVGTLSASSTLVVPTSWGATVRAIGIGTQPGTGTALTAGTGYTLTNSNLTMTSTAAASSNWVSAISTVGPITQPIYIEAKWNTLWAGNSVGFYTSSANLSSLASSFIGQIAGTFGEAGGTSAQGFYVEGSQQANSGQGAQNTNDIVSVAYDPTSKTVWYAINCSYIGSGTQNPATGAGGWSVSTVAGINGGVYLALALHGYGPPANVATLNATGSTPSASFTCGVPSGFNPTTYPTLTVSNGSGANASVVSQSGPSNFVSYATDGVFATH